MITGWAAFWLMIGIITVSEHWYTLKKRAYEHQGVPFKWWD